jgi:hypothetical protein
MDIPERHGQEQSASERAQAQPQDVQNRDASGTPEAENEDERRKLRRLQIMMSMVQSVLAQDNMTYEEASELATNAKQAALAMFPDKELAYDLIYKPRLQRLIRERFHLQ